MKKLSLEDFVSDLVSFNFFYEFLSQNGLLKKYNKHLDIGGDVAFFGFLCQSLNIAKDSTSIDLKKIENNNLLRIFIYYKFVIRNRFSKYKSLLRFVGKNGYVNRKTSIYNNLPILTFRGKLKTSTQNIFELTEKFDLITSIGSLEFFDPKKILKQIYELLNENGICYINVSYFWYLINKDKVKNKFFGEIREIHKNSKTYTVEDYSNLAN